MPLLAVLAVYLRGWTRLRRRRHRRASPSRALAFTAALALLALALVSPLDALAGSLLAAHMAQHLLLTMVVPPLLWLGWPLAPFLRGLPAAGAVTAVRALAWPPLRRLGRLAGHPVTAWLAFSAATWAWHAPALYDLAARSPAWHHVQHACFLGAGLMFWWPVVQPWPSRPVWPRWTLIPYLALADVQNTALAAILTFADRPLYAMYAAGSGAWGLSALEDQAAAGVLMWVPGSVAFLLPLGWLVARQLTPSAARRPAPVAPRSLC